METPVTAAATGALVGRDRTERFVLPRTQTSRAWTFRKAKIPLAQSQAATQAPTIKPEDTYTPLPVSLGEAPPYEEGTRRRLSVDVDGASKNTSKSPLLAREDAKGPDLSHILPHDLENDISEEEDREERGRAPGLEEDTTTSTTEDEESDSLGSAAEYEQDLSRKRDLAQVLRGEEGVGRHGPGPATMSGSSSASAVGVARSLLAGLSSISHNRRQAHIASEQKRRQSINEGFEDLRRAVPTCSNASDSKAVILRKAVNYINHLTGEVARLKGMLGGMGSGAPGSPMSPAPTMHHPHMVYPHSTSHGHAHSMLQPSMPMSSMSMPMQMSMQMHSPYQHPQDHPTMSHPSHHQHHGQYGTSGARQSPGPGSIYSSAGSAVGRGGTMHHMAQYSGVGAPSYTTGAHPLPPPPPPLSSAQAGMAPLVGYPAHSGGGVPLTGATNMSYPVNYGAPPGHYGSSHMPSVARPMGAPLSHGHAAVSGHGLPPLKSHEAYNRDDYASATSLSMLRREAPRGVGAEENN